MRVFNDVVISAAMDTSVASDAIDVQHIGMVAVVAKISGNATTGVLAIEGSCDAPDVAPSDWVTIPSGSVNMTTAGKYTLSVASLPYTWIRLVYTQAAGTGTLTVRLNGKGF